MAEEEATAKRAGVEVEVDCAMFLVGRPPSSRPYCHCCCGACGPAGRAGQPKRRWCSDHPELPAEPGFDARDFRPFRCRVDESWNVLSDHSVVLPADRVRAVSPVVSSKPNPNSRQRPRRPAYALTGPEAAVRCGRSCQLYRRRPHVGVFLIANTLGPAHRRRRWSGS